MQLLSTKYQADSFLDWDIRSEYRPTVSIALIERDEVVFVQSAKDAFGKTWILPQGGIDSFEYIYEAVEREVREELGFSLIRSKVDMQVLGEYDNELPPERHTSKPKKIYCVAVRGNFPYAFRLNGENNDVCRIGNPFALWQLMGDMQKRRPNKFWGTCNMLNEAHAKGLLSWSCHPILAALNGASDLKEAV